jgi:hypothetical protein
MKRAIILSALMFLAALSEGLAQGTAFTYSGRLSEGGNPANGLYDIRAGLYTVSAGGTVFAGPITNSAVAVSNGLFTITLDYGNVFDGTVYWLQVAVRTNGLGGFTVLSPRQQLTPTPYAIFAESANAAGLSGTIPSTTLSGVYGSALGLTNPANIFAGDGSRLAGVNATTLGGLASSNFWATTGNAGTSPTNGNFVGTTDNQPLELRVSGSRALRLEPIANASNISNMVNVVGGSPINSVTPGYVGATIAGGGASHYVALTSLGNSISGDFGTIGGGGANAVSATFGTVAGGRGNLSGGINVSTVGGGESNNAAGPYSTVSGGFNNAAIGGLFGGYTTVAGGAANTASGDYGTVSGGNANSANGAYATVGGGASNAVVGENATVAGGSSNLASNRNTTVGGGTNNMAIAAHATVAGGNGNTATGNSSTVGGGSGNYANFANATVAGGIENYAVAPSALVCGGNGNRADGTESMVVGGYANDAEGNRSFAAGSYAWAEYDGSFVWADDSSMHQFIGTAANVFFVRCTGGVKFTTATDSFGADAAGVKVASGGTSWSAVCDRNAKKNFHKIDTLAVLNKLATIPMEQWNYKWEDNTATPNLGPMAQDFKAAFYPGRDDKSISTLEFDGVELAAIQGLNEKLEERARAFESQLQQKDTEIRQLQETVSELKNVVSQLAQKKGEQ